MRDNTEMSRYELWGEDSLISFANYSHHDDVLTVHHVETRADLRGHGNADRLMAGLLEDLRARGLRVRPRCSHAVGYLRDHPADADLLAEPEPRAPSPEP